MTPNQPDEPTPTPHPTYQAPTVTPVGQWEIITLAQSIPIGPGSLGSLLDPSKDQNGF